MENIWNLIKQNLLVFILIIIIISLLFIVLLVMYKYYDKFKNPKEKVVVKKGIRYTKEINTSLINNSINITHKEDDIILVAGKKQSVTKKGLLKPGKYTIYSSEQGITKFNIRIAGFVKEFQHGQEIVVAEGDEITAVSHSLILR